MEGERKRKSEGREVKAEVVKTLKTGGGKESGEAFSGR